MNKPGKRISAKAVQKLLAEQPFREDEGLTSRVSGRPLLLEDGSVVLLFEDGKGTLYKTRQSLVELIDRIEHKAMSGPVDSANLLFPSVSEFIRQPRQIASRLWVLLNLEGVPLFNEDSLDEIERALNQLPKARRASQEVLSSLVAYVGELLREGTSGMWSAITPPSSNEEPIILASDNTIFQPVSLVLKELGLGSTGSLRGAVNGALNFYKFNSRRKDI